MLFSVANASMDSAKITQLAQLLRESGDKVLNDNYKLTLSGQLLQGLSDSFRVIVDDADEQLVAGGNGGIHGADDTSHFQVVSKYHNARTPEMRDLQLIYDFVQKTRILCVTNFTGQHASDASVDITKFRNLRRLEISKLSVSRVRGIQEMRAHLQELKCEHSIDSVEEIISHCGGDRCYGFTWNELHTVDFSYNKLRSVDGALEFATSLQYLNLSHNQIESVEAVKWLKNLKHLNVSFNRLPYVPQLHMDSRRHLLVLLLSNNFIEDMSGESNASLCVIRPNGLLTQIHSIRSFATRCAQRAGPVRQLSARSLRPAAAQHILRPANAEPVRQSARLPSEASPDNCQVSAQEHGHRMGECATWQTGVPCNAMTVCVSDRIHSSRSTAVR